MRKRHSLSPDEFDKLQEEIIRATLEHPGNTQKLDSLLDRLNKLLRKTKLLTVIGQQIQHEVKTPLEPSITPVMDFSKLVPAPCRAAKFKKPLKEEVGISKPALEQEISLKEAAKKTAAREEKFEKEVIKPESKYIGPEIPKEKGILLETAAEKQIQEIKVSKEIYENRHAISDKPAVSAKPSAIDKLAAAGKPAKLEKTAKPAKYEKPGKLAEPSKQPIKPTKQAKPTKTRFSKRAKEEPQEALKGVKHKSEKEIQERFKERQKKISKIIEKDKGKLT
ncbi:hypothetical protein ACFL96_01010 [Thermoproteota archaeon]